jgi:hypothetical protein
MPSKRIKRKLARQKLEKELQAPPAPPAEPEPRPKTPDSLPELEPEPVADTCIYIIGRGKRKGQECGKKCKEGLYCSLHTEKAIEY